MNQRVKAALIRFGWTFIFAFFSQPVVVAIVNALEGAHWPSGITWHQVIFAAVAALIYAVKKYIWPNTTF